MNSAFFQIARFGPIAGWGPVTLRVLAFALVLNINSAMAADRSIVDAGAIPDGKTLNTKAIQSAIDKLASNGGGTVIIPPGKFLSGALLLKTEGKPFHPNFRAVSLLGSTNIEDYPIDADPDRRPHPSLASRFDQCLGLR